MTKSEKREQAIRDHPTQTRFPDLDALLVWLSPLAAAQWLVAPHAPA